MERNLTEIEYIIRYMSDELLKVLRIDLQTDSFTVIKAEEDSMPVQDSAPACLSEWFRDFMAGGNVYPRDLQRFREKTDLNYLRTYFLGGGRKLSLSYRRVKDRNYRWVSMRIIPAYNYSSANQEVLMFVQEDDSAESLDIVATARQQFAILHSMADAYITMHAISFESDTIYDLRSVGSDGFSFLKQEGVAALMDRVIRERIVPSHLEEALAFSDLTTVQDRMLGRKFIVMDLLEKELGWIRAKFTAIQPDQQGRPRNVIFTTAVVNEEKQREEKMNRISAELNLATAIQNGCMPSTFPAFPNRKELDLYAFMKTAKEVGGDFYDFFEIDADRIALVIADVSGKGIPAALFMMVSKVLIENQAAENDSPAAILQRVNARLCQNNPHEMFVTMWLGILDTKTGVLRCANAGHEYPVVRHAGGSFESLHDPHGLVLGGMEGSKYREYSIELSKGDVLFVYTDGVIEANNAEGALYGRERMLEALNCEPDAPCDVLLHNVYGSVNAFTKREPQFDDMTMLALRYYGACVE